MTRQNSQGDNSPNVNGDHNEITINPSIQIKVSNEIKTIQIMIGALTKLAKTEKTGTQSERGDIDPEKKFDKRFSTYSLDMKKLYTDLSIKYGEHYEIVLSDLQPGRTDTDIIANFLRHKSIFLLEKNNGNPIVALDALCTHFEENFFSEKSDEFEFDNGALRYFVYKQLVECNVFPNPAQDNE